MHTKLTPQERLKDLRVVDKHLTLEQLEAQTGLSRAALGNYERKNQGISAFAIATLANFYGVSIDYLMGLTENKNHSNTELQALHLSDDMVALLSSGTINNRLLCEIATHKNFRRLMTDIEIFVDRIADMRVEQMNLILEATRQEIIRKHEPGGDDLYLRTLELGQVQETAFYSHVLHDDLDSSPGYSGFPCHRPHHSRPAAHIGGCKRKIRPGHEAGQQRRNYHPRVLREFEDTLSQDSLRGFFCIPADTEPV